MVVVEAGAGEVDPDAAILPVAPPTAEYIAVPDAAIVEDAAKAVDGVDKPATANVDVTIA